MGRTIKNTIDVLANSKPSISPRQRWARRRNWEKNQMEYFHKELTFRLNGRWKKTDLRSQTQTDDEIKELQKVISLLHRIVKNWNRNSVTRRQEMNFNQYK